MLPSSNKAESSWSTNSQNSDSSEKPCLICFLLLFFVFSVVTSITFKLHEIPGNILGGELYYSISKGASAYKAIRDFVRQKADKRISVYMMLHFNDAG